MPHEREARATTRTRMTATAFLPFSLVAAPMARRLLQQRVEVISMPTQEDYRDWNELGPTDEQALQRLGYLCAMEASACRSYENALLMPHLWNYRHVLRAIRDSHQER